MTSDEARTLAALRSGPIGKDELTAWQDDAMPYLLEKGYAQYAAFVTVQDHLELKQYVITFEGFEALREFEYNQVQHAQNYAAKKRDVAEHEMNRIEDTKRGILITVIGWVFLLLFSDRFWIAAKTVKKVLLNLFK